MKNTFKKHIGRTLSIFLAIFLLLGTIPIVGVSAATNEPIISGNFEYYVLPDGTIRLNAYYGDDEYLNVPSYIDGYEVTVIGRGGALWFFNEGMKAFNTKEIFLPKTLKNFLNNDASYGFTNWTSLESIYVDEENPYFCSKNGCLYNSDFTKLLYYPEGKKDTEFFVPESVTDIVGIAFNRNSSLKKLYLGRNIKSIGNYGFEYFDDITFYVYNNSYALDWAKEHGFAYEIMEEPTSVSLNKTSLTLDVGKSYTLTKIVSPSNAVTSYTWRSSNTSVATVDKNGKVTAKASGTATITVKTSNGKAANCKVTVNLPAPQITGLANTTGGIKISWNKVDGAYGYRLYYKPASGGWKRFKDTTATSFTDSGVVPNKTETYTIRCIDKNGKTVSGFNSKGWSKKYTATTPKITKLTNTSKGVSVTWNKIAGVYGYRLYQKTSNGWKRIKDTTATSFTDSAVSANQTKTYTIRCIDKNGKTVSGFNSKGWSKKYTAATPKITKLTNRSKGVSVTWNKIAGVYGYRLYRKYDGGSWTKVKDTTSTSFTDSGAKKGKKVTYTVRCIDRKGKTVSGFNSKGWSITRK